MLLRLGQTDRARRLTEANLRICSRNEWLDDVARCRWILGRADTIEGGFDTASEHLDHAESTWRRSHMLKELPVVLLAIAELHRRRCDWADALRYADEALRIAAPRSMLLDQADALVLRGRVVLDQALGDPTPSPLVLHRARDDGDAALEIARDTGYAWAERDALFLIADTSAALGDTSRARSTRTDAQHFARRLQLPDPRPG